MLLKVEKMTCQHCVRAVTNAVTSVAPGAQVAVDLPTQQVRVAAATDPEAIAAALRAEGYTAVVLER